MDLTCPISSCDLPGVADLRLQGLIVVVGPNSSGKTQLLHDINEAVCGRPRQLVVATGVCFRAPPPFKEYFEFLVARGSIAESSPDNFFKRTLQYGADEGGGAFRKRVVESQYNEFCQAVTTKAQGSLPGYLFLKELGLLSCSVLFLKNRLTLMDSCGNYNYSTEGPSRTLQALYRNKNAKHALYDEIANVFRSSVWVDATRHSALVLRVSNSTPMPSAEDRLEPEIMDRYRTIETEGDGLRSYSAICTTLEQSLFLCSGLCR